MKLLTYHCVPLQTRMIKDYSDPAYLAPRIADKIFIAFLMTSLYYGLGNNNVSSNVQNISSLLFMWATLPGFTAVAYIPAIVLDKPLFRRYALVQTLGFNKLTHSG